MAPPEKAALEAWEARPCISWAGQVRVTRCTRKERSWQAVHALSWVYRFPDLMPTVEVDSLITAQ